MSKIFMLKCNQYLVEWRFNFSIEYNYNEYTAAYGFTRVVYED